MCNFDPYSVREIFPAFSSKLKDLTSSFVYLDSAATTQKPQVVIDCLQQFYSNAQGNVYRATHFLSSNTSQHYNVARQIVADFISAQNNEIIFTRGATEGINLIAHSFSQNGLIAEDEIILSEMEHHANIVPWQQVAKKAGAKIVPWRMNKTDCTLDIEEFEKLLTPKTKIIAIAHTSNVTGTRHPIEQVIARAHEIGAIVVVDGAQGIVHEKIDLTALDADFFVFSGHKLFAPTGIGVLYGKAALLESMPPWQCGGKMIESVSMEETVFAPPPARFEAGTPNTAGALALAEAIKWYQGFNLIEIEKHIHNLRKSLVENLSQIDGLRIIGSQENSSIVAFNIEGVHHSDLATLLDNQGIYVRSGHHCAHPLMNALGINGCVRISIALYNNLEDIHRCIEGIKKAREIL